MKGRSGWYDGGGRSGLLRLLFFFSLRVTGVECHEWRNRETDEWPLPSFFLPFRSYSYFLSLWPAREFGFELLLLSEGVGDGSRHKETARVQGQVEWQGLGLRNLNRLGRERKKYKEEREKECPGSGRGGRMASLLIIDPRAGSHSRLIVLQLASEWGWQSNLRMLHP